MLLILSIWMIAIFSFFALVIYRISSPQLERVKRFQESFLSQEAAFSALNFARKLLESDRTSYDSLYELSQERKADLGLISFSYHIVDEEGKININKVSPDILSRLPGLDYELAENIQTSSLRPFICKEELLYVEGISQELFSQFEDLVTVYGRGRVNINTASSGVLLALGMDEGLVEIIEDFRKGEDGQEATEDDRVFKSRGRIVSDLTSFASLSPFQINLLNSLIGRGLIGVGSNSFSLVVSTKVLNRESFTYQIFLVDDIITQWKRKRVFERKKEEADE